MFTKSLEKDLIFDLIYQITSLESVPEMDRICSRIFALAQKHLKRAYKLIDEKKLEEGKKEFYIGDTYLLAIDQVLGERLGPVMLNVHLRRFGIKDSLEFMTKIDQKKEHEIEPELKDLVDYYKIIKKWKQKCWLSGEKVRKFKNKLAVSK